MKLRNTFTNTFKKFIILPVMFTAVNASASPTITPQEFKEGYRLVYCKTEDVPKLECSRPAFTSDMNAFEYIKHLYGDQAEVVEVSVEFATPLVHMLVIKIKLN